MTQNRKLAYAALLGNMVLWALAIPLAKRGFADGLTPTTFLLGRYVLAAIISLPVIALISRQSTVKSVFRLSNLLKVTLLEILGTVIVLWLLYEGVTRTTAVEASLIAVTWPIFVTIGGVILLKEKEELHELAGLSLAIAGTTVLVAGPVANGFFTGSLIGNLLILGQNLTGATYYLLAKRFYQPFNKWAVTHLSFWVGILGFGSIQLLQGISPITSLTSLWTNPSPWPLIATVYMAIGGSILGLTLYLIGQDKIEASEAAVFTYLEPLIGIPASMLLLGETVTPLQIITAIIIALGVFLAEHRPRLVASG